MRLRIDIKRCVYIVILSVVLLCGCGKSNIANSGNNTPITINFWHYYKGSQLKILEEQINTFNSEVGSKEGIIVEATSMRSANEIYDLLITSVNNEPGAPELPSIAMAYPDAAVTFNNMDILSSYNSYFTKEELGMYLDDFLKEGMITDTDDVFVFPISKSSEVLYINYTAYKEFIDDYNKQNADDKLSEDMLETFGGILKASKAYYEWTDSKTPDILNDGKALYGLDSTGNFAIASFNQMGDSFFSPVDGKMTIGTRSDTFKLIWDYYYVPMVTGYFAAYSFYRAEDAQTGDILMYTGSTGGASFFPTTVTYNDNTQQDIELKVMPYPVHKGGTPSAVLQGAGLMLVKSNAREEMAAATFVKWLTSPKNNTDFVLGSGYLPVTKEAFDTILRGKLLSVDEGKAVLNVNKVITQTIQSYENVGFTSYKPFDGSEDLRFFYEDMMLQKALDDREKFIGYMEHGHTYEEACEQFFEKSAYDSFVKEVENEIKKLED